MIITILWPAPPSHPRVLRSNEKVPKAQPSGYGLVGPYGLVSWEGDIFFPMAALLRVKGLCVEYPPGTGGVVRALGGISFEIQHGEILGVLGESGSGKTTLARALAGILPRTAQISGGSIDFSLPDSRPACGTSASHSAKAVLISQDPGISLNPVIRVGDQIVEVLRANNPWSKSKCRAEARELLRSVHLDEDPKLYDAYPHQISGGQQQRVVIAQALACRPDLLIADEPTASLDESAIAGILELLKRAVSERKMALLIITHTPELLVNYAQRVLVMYGGRVIEACGATELFRDPLHPYTKALLQCQNSGLTHAGTRRGRRFATIAGDAPNLEMPISGCIFAARCDNRLSRCSENIPTNFQPKSQRSVECFLYAE